MVSYELLQCMILAPIGALFLYCVILTVRKIHSEKPVSEGRLRQMPGDVLQELNRTVGVITNGDVDNVIHQLNLRRYQEQMRVEHRETRRRQDAVLRPGVGMLGDER